MAENFLSIVIPSYNQGRFIKQTIDSILNEGLPNVEVLVMDGGSKDETVEVLKSYGDKIQWVSEKDKGQTDAINKGMRRTKGNILAYINSDDYYLPGTLGIILNYFNKKPLVKWFTGDYIIVDEKNKIIQSFVVIYKRILRLFPFYWVLSIANFISQPSTFWSREVLDEIGAFDESLHYVMDYDFWMRIYRKWRPGIINEKLSAFRIHGQSKGGAQFEKQFAEEFEVVKKYQKNGLILFLHKIHNMLINWVYRRIK